MRSTIIDVVDSISLKDKEMHRKLLNNISENYRWLPVDLLIDKYKAFYVPNDEYIKSMYDSDVVFLPEYDLYYKSTGAYTCKYYKRIVIPIRNILGDIAGLCGYTGDSDTKKYTYSNKKVWKKENHVFCERKDLIKAMEEDYIFITDGIFDKLILEYYGFNAMCLMGSHVSFFMGEILKFIKHPILVTDNDTAGRALLQKLKKKNSGVIEFQMQRDNDIYDFLVRDAKNVEEFKQVFDKAKRTGFLFSQVLVGC